MYAGTPFRFAAPPRTLPLLAWLLMHRRAPLARDAIAFAFWPDASEEDARGDLRRHLYYLAKALPPNGEPWIVADKKTIAWNPRAQVAFDVADFERLCGNDATLAEAVLLYRGPLLSGSDDEWLEEERERLKMQAENALLRLVTRASEADPARAIAYAQQLLRMDPWREDAIRALTLLRHRTGDRAGALREYRDFADRLRAELQVAPMPETTAVYEAIAHADTLLPLTRGTSPEPTAVTFAPGPRTNLANRADVLIGRENALTEILALLETTRIATLAGTGGVGKTRLAIEAGWAALDAYPDGVWFADCGPLTDGSLVLCAVAAGVGIANATERPQSATVIAALRRKRSLLIVDNCEHVVAEVACVVSELVAGCPELRVLATSREPLAVRGERVYRVPSLDVPADLDLQFPLRARTYGAIALFEARATAVKPDFILDASNVAIVGDICRRLDGIALAIELAAARVTVLAPHELARRLEERFRVLSGGERTALPRQRTMRALIDWSWDLCSEAERTLLRRVAVFAGGWTFEAAECVCFEAPIDVADAISLLGSLVEKSLLVADASGAGNRYRLLESIREYAREKLDAAGERIALARRHAAYFTTFAITVDEAYESTPDDLWYAPATAELDNVRAAIAFSFDDDSAGAARLASAYGTVWDYGSSRADRQWLDLAYERLDRVAHEALTVRLLYQIASISQADGRHAEWVGVAVRDRGDARTRADALLWLAERYVRGGRLDIANATLDEATTYDDALRRPKTHAKALCVRGELAASRGDLQAATALFERAIVAGIACGAIAIVAAARVALAEAAFAAGDIGRACVVAEEARATIEAHFGRTIAYADVTANLAGYAIAAGDFDTARSNARESLEIARTLDFPQRVVVAVEHLAVLAGLGGDLDRGAYLLGFAEAERGRRSVPRGATARGGYERLCAALRREFDEDDFVRRLARGAIAGSERASTRALE